MHSVCLVGEISGPPMVRVEGQYQLTTFTLAVLEPRRAAASFTLSVPCVAWGRVAETAGLLHAEDLVCVQGAFCGHQHLDKNGQEKNTLAVNVHELRVLQVPGAVALPPERPVGGGEKCE